MKKILATLFSGLLLFTTTTQVNAAMEELGSAEEMFFGEIPMVVVASGRRESADQAPAHVFVITGQEIKKRGYRSLIDVFSDLPGAVWFNSNGDHDHSPTIRGVNGTEKIKLLINGMDFDARSGLGTTWNNRFPVDGIDRIEFIIGPYASLYGRNSFSGVMNVVTKTGSQIDGVITSGLFGKWARRQGTAILGKKVNATDVYFSLHIDKSEGIDLAKDYPGTHSIQARRQHNPDGWFVNTLPDPGFSENYLLPWEGREAYIRLQHDSGLSLDVLFNEQYTSQTGTGLPPFYYLSDRAISPRHEPVLNARLEYKRDSGGALVNKTRLIHQNHRVDGANAYLSGLNVRKRFGNRAESYKIENTSNYTLSDAHNLFMGLSWEGVREQPQKQGDQGTVPFPPLIQWAPDERHRPNYLNVSIQDEYTFGDHLKTLVGLMYQRSNIHDDLWIPRGAAVWNVNQQNIVKFLVGGGFLPPEPSSRQTAILPGGLGTKGSTELTPETANSYEIQYLARPNNNVRFTTSFFYTKIRDVVTQVTLTGDPLFGTEWVNLGSSESLGGEFYMDALLFGKTTFFGSYGYVEGKINDHPTLGDVFGLPTSVAQHFKLGLTTPFWQDKLNLHVRNLYVGKAQNFHGASFSLPGYNTVDLHVLTTQTFNDRWDISLGVTNLFNETGVDAPPDNSPTFWFPVPIPRRQWSVKISAKL